MDREITLCVCTYNSAKTLHACLSSLRGALPEARLIVMDHSSTDGSKEIARAYAAEVHTEDVGLGWARQKCIEMVATPYFAFVDSDVELTYTRFFEKALEELECDPGVGAVVGMSRGHRIAFGLPASLLVLRKADFEGAVIPWWIDARETFYIQRRLLQLGRRTVYVYDSMVHRSQYRRYKPEWEGANTRLLESSHIKELFFSLVVIIFISLNSKNIKNIAYIPIFYLKFLRGFTHPDKWLRLVRG